MHAPIMSQHAVVICNKHAERLMVIDLPPAQYRSWCEACEVIARQWIKENGFTMHSFQIEHGNLTAWIN